MKLHLPKMLTAALLAVSAVTASAATYSGTVYTYNGDLFNKNDIAYSQFYVTTYDGDVATVHTDQVVQPSANNNWSAVSAIWGGQNYINTFRFDANYGQSRKSAVYSFGPFGIGGIIVDEGAEGFSISNTGNNKRNLYLGTTVSGATAYSTIKEDFSLNQTSTNQESIIHLRGGQVFDVASGKTFHINQSNGNALDFGSQLTVQGGGTVAFDGSSRVALTSAATLTVETGSTVTFAGAVTGLSNTITNNGIINFGSTVAVADFSGFDGDVVYSDTNNGFVTSAEYTLIEGTGTSNLTAVQYGTTTLTVTDNKVNVDEADYSTYYLNDDDATVSIAAAAGEAQSHEGTLANIVVKGADTGITSDSTGMILNSLSLGAGAGTTVSGTEQLTVGAVTFSAGSKLALAEDASVKVLTKPTFTTGSQVTVAEGSVLDLSSYTSNPDAIEAIAANVTGAGSVKIAATGELSFSENGTTTVLTALEGFSDAEFNGKGWVAGSYGHIFNIGDGSRTGSLKAAGTLRLESKVHVNVNQGSSLVVDGTLAMGHKQAGNPGHLVVNGGTLTVGHILLQDDTTANTFSLTNATVEVTQAGDVFTGTGAATAVTTSGLLVKNLSDGDITWNHASDYAGGDLAVDANGHTITLGVAGGTSTLHNTIEVQDGDTVGFAGTWDVSHLAGDAQPTYKDGVSDGNGYASLEIAVQLATGAITAESDAATFIIKGVAGTLDHATGKVTTSSEPDYATYFLNENFETYSDIIEVAAQHQELTGGIVVAEDAVLLADADMDMSVVSASSKGTVEIDEDVVVTAAGGTQAVQLTGAGIYALAANTQTLGSVNVDYFSGNVRLSGNITDINLDGNLGSANVEFKGLSGYFKNLDEGTDATYEGNIHLENDGDTPAIKITNGYSRTESEYIFAGDISGEGTWELNCGATQHYVFTGDLYDWNGEFKVTNSGGNNGGTSLAFRENATTVYAAITRNGGTLKLSVENYATFNGDVTGVTSLTVAEGYSATFNGTASIGSLIGAGEVYMENDLTLTGTTTSSADGDTNFTGTLMLRYGTSLTVTGNVDLGNHLIASADNAITVEGSLALTEGSFIGDQTIQNSGTVTLSGVVVDSMGTHLGEEAHFDLNGHETGSSNYYHGVTGDYVQVVDGGTSSGTVNYEGRTFDLQGNGRAVVGEDEVEYNTYYVGGETSVEDITNGEHADELWFIEVMHGGTLDVNTSTQATIKAQDGATVKGNQAQESVEIATGAEVKYTNGISSTEGVYVYGLDGVSVTNNSGSAATYGGLDDATMAVEADALSSIANEEYVVNNQLSVTRVEHQGDGELTLAHVNGDALSVVETGTADLILQGITATTLSELTIGGGATVGVYTDTTKATEGTVTIDAAGVLTAGGSTLLANLTLVGDSTLDVRGGGDNALTLGSTLKVDTTTSFINLDNDTLIALDALQVGQRLALVKAKDGTTLAYGGEYADAWFDGMFNREGSQYTLAGDFQVFADSDAFGLVKFSNTPEPTTGTLSLLALAALAARRRKH